MNTFCGRYYKTQVRALQATFLLPFLSFLLQTRTQVGESIIYIYIALTLYQRNTEDYHASFGFPAKENSQRIQIILHSLKLTMEKGNNAVITFYRPIAEQYLQSHYFKKRIFSVFPLNFSFLLISTKTITIGKAEAF